jgi:hypothetical protein
MILPFSAQRRGQHHVIVMDGARCNLGQNGFEKPKRAVIAALRVKRIGENRGINLARSRSGALEAILASREIGDDF